MEMLPRLLPEDAGARKNIFDRVLTVTTASGPPSETRRDRLRALAERFGLDPDTALDLKIPKRSSKKRPEPAAVRRRAS